MRKVSNYSRKIEKFLLKSLGHYKAGLLRSLNVEIGGVRYLGQRMSDVSMEEGVLSFSYGEKSFQVKLEEILSMKRLRTKKYCFFCAEQSKKAKKPAKKAEKKAEKPEKKAEKKKEVEPKKEDKE